LVWLILASAVAGLVLARTFRAYALIPATVFIVVPAWYLGAQQGFAIGLTAFVVSTVVMQVVYFASLLTYLLIQNLSLLDHVQSEASPPIAESRAAL
jgi:hypothetical protein